MADENPANDVSSYSDPIYDRLERVNRVLASNWRLITIVILAAVIGLTVLGNSGGNSAEAQSATAYNNAAGDADKLKAVAADSSILAEFRFQAANDLVQQALDNDKLEEAQQYLTVASEQAQAAKSDKLKMYAHISTAALQSEAGELEAAINSYSEALAIGRNSDFKAAGYLAQFNKAQLQIRAAASTEDASVANELRSSALSTLDQLRSAQGSAQGLNGSRLQEAAEYSYYDLLRKFPALAASELPVSVEVEAEAEAELPADPVEAAPAE